MKKIISILVVLAMLLSITVVMPVSAAETTVSGYQKLSFKDSNAVVYKSNTTKLSADEVAALTKMPVANSTGGNWGRSMVRWSNVKLDQGISAMDLWIGGDASVAKTISWELWVIPADSDTNWDNEANDFAEGYGIQSGNVIGADGATNANSYAYKSGSTSDFTLSWKEEKISTNITWRSGKDMSLKGGTYNIYFMYLGSDFYGIEFSPQPKPEVVSGYEKLAFNAANAVAYKGGNTRMTSYEMASQNVTKIAASDGAWKNTMIRWSNVRLDQGIAGINLYAGGTKNAANTTTWNMWIVPADEDIWWNDKTNDFADGYGYVSANRIGPLNLNSDNSHAWKQGTSGTHTLSWVEEKVSTSYVWRNANTDMSKCCGVYNIYITVATWDFYGIEFVSQPAKDGLNWINTNDAVGHGTGSDIKDCEAGTSVKSYKGLVEFKNVNLGTDGLSKLYINIAQKAADLSGKAPVVEIRVVERNDDGSNMYTNADGTWKEGYSASWIIGTTAGVPNFPSTFYHQYTANDCTSWNPYVLTMDLGDKGATYKGVYDIFVSTNNQANLYGIKFEERTLSATNFISAAEYQSIFGAKGVVNPPTYNANTKLIAFSNNRGGVLFKNIDFGEKGVGTFTISWAGGAGDYGKDMSMYILPQGLDLLDENGNISSTYSLEGDGYLYKTGTSNKIYTAAITTSQETPFGGWNENSKLTVNIPNGNEYTGKHDVLIVMEYGDFRGFSFTEYVKPELSAFNYLSAANDATVITAVEGSTTQIPTLKADASGYQFTSRTKGMLAFKDVEFGENGVDAVTFRTAPGQSIGQRLSVYIVPKTSTEPWLNSDGTYNYDAKYNIEAGYIWKPGSGGIYTPTATTIALSTQSNLWATENVTVAIPNGKKYTGKCDVFVTANYGDFYGIQFDECELIDGIDPFADDTDVNLVYIGGSITEGVAGDVAAADRWATITGNYIAEKFAKDGRTFTTHNVGIGGTGSDYGLLRIQKDVMSKNPDMVFIEFAVNDGGSEAGLYQMETIVRTLQAMENPPYIAFVYTTTEKLTSLSKYHNEIATAYGLAEIDIRDAIESKGAEFVNEYVNSDKYLCDGVHPTALGHEFYAEVINKALNYKDAYTKAETLEEPVSEKSRIVDIEEISIDDYTISGTEGVDYKVDGDKIYLYTDGTTISFKSSGDLIGFMEYKFAEGGYYSISINGRKLHEEDEYLDSYIADYPHPEAYLYMDLPYRENFDVTITKLSEKNAELTGDSVVIIGKAFKNKAVSDNEVEYMPEDDMTITSNFTVINSSDRNVDLVYNAMVDEATNGQYLKYENVDLTNIANYNIITARIAAANSTGKLKIMADAVDGTLVAEIDPGNLTDWNTLSRISGAITEEGLALTGKHDLYVVYSGDDCCKFEGFVFSLSTDIDDIAKFDASNYSELNSVTPNTTTNSFGSFNTIKDWICWNDIDFGTVSKARTVEISYGTNDYYNGVIQLRLDSIAGPVIAEMPIKYQDGINWTAPKTLEIPVSKDVTGVHTLYVTLGTTDYMTHTAPAADLFSIVFKDANGYASNYITLGDTNVVEPKEILNSLTFTKGEDTPQSIVFATAIYDENGRVVELAADAITPAEGMNYAEQSIVLPNEAGTYKVKGFIWDGGNVNPLTNNNPLLDEITITVE